MTSREPTGQAISDEAVKVAAEVLFGEEGYTYPLADALNAEDYDGWADHYLGMARLSLAAALPHIRSAIADEIEAAKVPLHDPNIEIQRLNAVIRAAYDGAARVARGGPTE